MTHDSYETFYSQTADERASRFARVYREGLWGEYPLSGTGSTSSYAANARAALEEIIANFGVTSLLDAGCGDLTWLREIDLRGIRYMGVDIVPDVIDQHRLNLRDREGVRFEVLDLVTTVAPAHDLILCRHALSHLGAGDVRQALCNFSASGSRWLLTTTYISQGQDLLHPSADPQASAQLNLLEPPYELPDPVRLYVEGGHPRDRQYLGLWQLPFADWP
jgi:SAM-dependent methyltransferase